MNTGSGVLWHSFARLWRRGVLAVVAVTLAVLACYGVLALAALLPLLGMRLVLDASLWGGAIVAFTVLTVLAVLPGVRAHGAWTPVAAACAGAALILYALLVDYHAGVELAGFVMLAAAVVRDSLLRRRSRRPATAGAATGRPPG